MSDPTWDQKAEFMRRHGAVFATWDQAERLTSLSLGPANAAAPVKTQHTETAETEAPRTRAEHSHVSGLVKAGDGERRPR